MIDENKESGLENETRENKPTGSLLKEVLIDSPLFPAIAILTRSSTLALSLGVPIEDPYVGAYIITSGFSDLGEMIYRVYSHNEIDNGPPMKNPSFSCFEKHVLYDLPKYLYKKFRKKK